MKATLKEILKPPFRHDHCGCGEVFVDVNKVHFSDTRIMQIRGWGFFQNFENGAELQDEFKDFVVQALNEKWERDNLKQKRDKINEVILLLENRWRDMFEDIENGEQLQNKLMECVVKILSKKQETDNQ